MGGGGGYGRNVCHAESFICFSISSSHNLPSRREAERGNEMKLNRTFEPDLSHFNYIYQQDICLCTALSCCDM
jgi:hypothetical protein